MTSTRDTGWTFLFVRGQSMRPTFGGVRRFAVARLGRTPRVGDVVVAVRPDRRDMRVIKRVTDRDSRGWWLESDHERDLVQADSWLFGHVADEDILGVVVWPRVSRPQQ